MTATSDHDSKAGAPNEWLLQKECAALESPNVCIFIPVKAVILPTASSRVTPQLPLMSLMWSLECIKSFHVVTLFCLSPSFPVSLGGSIGTIPPIQLA